MMYASRAVRDLLLVVDEYSAHMGCSVGQLSNFSVGWAGLFVHLREGGDCTTATLESALDWFDYSWPSDLCWPKSVRRPFRVPGGTSLMAEGFRPKLSSEDADFLVRLAHAPVWTTGRRPPWWGNLEIREFLTRAHRQQTLAATLELGRSRFGDAFPSMSAIHRFWMMLDDLNRSAPFRPRFPKKKEAA